MLPQSVAVAPNVHDVAVMHEAVDERAGHDFIAGELPRLERVEGTLEWVRGRAHGQSPHSPRQTCRVFACQEYRIFSRHRHCRKCGRQSFEGRRFDGRLTRPANSSKGRHQQTIVNCGLQPLLRRVVFRISVACEVANHALSPLHPPYPTCRSETNQ